MEGPTDWSCTTALLSSSTWPLLLWAALTDSVDKAVRLAFLIPPPEAPASPPETPAALPLAIDNNTSGRERSASPADCAESPRELASPPETPVESPRELSPPLEAPFTNIQSTSTRGGRLATPLELPASS